MSGYAVSIEIVEIRGDGRCPEGHHVGERFDYPRDRGKLCEGAMHSLTPFLWVLDSGGSYSWFENEGNSYTACCPDPKRPVVFKMTRSEI